MYKAFKNKRYYLAFNTFNVKSKLVSKVYLSGIRIWESDDCTNYSLVIYRFRIIFAINKLKYGECNG